MAEEELWGILRSLLMDRSLLQQILPIGFKFMPTDDILVEHYLFNKIHGIPYSQAVVFDCDLYGLLDPWDIWNSFGGVDGQDLFFFTKLKRSSTKSGQISSHIKRKIGAANGTWSGENSATLISPKGHDDKTIGYCKRFRYENPNLEDHHGEWIMHEYSLHHSFLLPNCSDPNYVLCRLRKNERPKRKAILNNTCSFKVEPTKKIVVDAMMNNDMVGKNDNDEKLKRIVNKRRISKLVPKKERVVAPTIISNIPCDAQMTTSQVVVNDYTPQMANDEIEFQESNMSIIPVTSDVSYMPQNTRYDSKIDFCASYLNTNQNTRYVLCTPEMNKSMSNVSSYIPKFTTDEIDTTTIQETSNVLDTHETNQSTNDIVASCFSKMTSEEEFGLWLQQNLTTDDDDGVVNDGDAKNVST